jgi:hypothetical protein
VGARWPGHAVMGRRGPLASGPSHLNFFLNFEISTNFEIQNEGLLTSKITEILQVNLLKYKEQLYFLDQVQIPSRLHVTNSGTISSLNLP